MCLFQRIKFLDIFPLENYYCDSFANSAEYSLTDENYDRLWKMRNVFHNVIDVYTEYYSPTEHLAVNLALKSLGHFQTVYTKETHGFGRKIYKLHDCHCDKSYLKD
jgi:hypothetical protein